MIAELEPLAFVLRVGPAETFEQAFDWSCTVQALPDNVAFLKGALGAPPAGGRDAIRKALKAAGFKRFMWERTKRGRHVFTGEI